MTDDGSTNLYPIGMPSDGEAVTHGWFVVTLDATGEIPNHIPPVLAVPLPLSDDVAYQLTIEVQCEQLTLKAGDRIAAEIPCGDKGGEILQILAGDRLGLLEVGPDFRLHEDLRMKINHKAEIDMLPFYQEFKQCMERLRDQYPEDYQTHKARFEAMPAWRRAAEQAASLPAPPEPVKFTDEDHANIWDKVVAKKPLKSLSASSPDPIKNALLKGRSSSQESGEGQ